MKLKDIINDILNESRIKKLRIFDMDDSEKNVNAAKCMALKHPNIKFRVRLVRYK